MDRYQKIVTFYEDLEKEKIVKLKVLDNAIKKMEKVKLEQTNVLSAIKACKDVKSILSANTIEQCEQLSNSALHAIFQSGSVIKYSDEDSKFVIDEGEGKITDLVEDNGGGYMSVISFIFDVFLIIKTGSRRFLAFDEQFTGVSKVYFPEFLEFLNKLCTDLNFDILLVTHDERITEDNVNHIYEMVEGEAIKHS